MSTISTQTFIPWHLADGPQDDCHCLRRSGAVEVVGMEEHRTEVHPVPLLLSTPVSFPGQPVVTASERFWASL